MRVAVDIDGVLSRTFEKYGEELSKRGYDTSGQAEEFVQWETSMLYPKVPATTTLAMYEDNWASMRSSYELYPGADIVLQLIEHDLEALTNRRVFSEGEVCAVTKQWFVTHGIPISRIIHTSDKAAVMQEEGFDVLIEDSPRNAVPVAETGAHVLLFDQVYNRHVQHPNVTRFTHWIEVPALLRRLAQRADSR